MKSTKNNRYISQKSDYIHVDKQFENMVHEYYSNKPYIKERYKEPELEVRFGTKEQRYFNKLDYDNVIFKLKSLGFKTENSEGNYLLRIETEFLDPTIGTFKQSNIRTEINGLNAIEHYCKNNDIKSLIENSQPEYDVRFNKKYVYEDKERRKMPIVNFNDFNFRISYQIEENVSKTGKTGLNIINNWLQTKKSFRYINRVSFKKEDIPISIDISIVKNSYGKDYKDKKGKKYTTIQDSNVFNNNENYEMEMEIINMEIGPGTPYNNSIELLKVIKKTIKYVLSGLQGSNYPISFKEQNDILMEYMYLLYKEQFHLNQKIRPNNFIGPNSKTLQIKNIVQLDNNNNIPNIRKDYCVTDKADGLRHLLFIASSGKIYLINTNMKVKFTGGITKNKMLFNSLIDGELILNDKNGKFINLYAAFDIYYLNNKDIRDLPFQNNLEKQNNNKNFRYTMLIDLIDLIDPVSVLKDNICPIQIKYKIFHSTNSLSDMSIFAACNYIISNINNNHFEYNTDGIIFTPMNYGVGSNKMGVSGSLKKITWDYSFKWKPSEYNTIDFLVTTVKNSSNQEIIQNIFEDGTNATIYNQLNQYKTLILRCGFDEKKHGYINPCQDVLEDKLPMIHKSENEYEDSYKPVQFYPSNPYDPNAGICNIMVTKDGNGNIQMFTQENEVITDNTIVEFKYDFNKPQNWNWVPLRVRYDKTSELRNGIKNYGNSYDVANNNWNSIHNPISEEMISTGKNIPEEILDGNIYYNRIVKTTSTKGMRDFHNLYIKKKIIYGSSKPGNILIDYACGKGGDLSKWIETKLSFVFGIDISKDNLENRIDGACARFLNFCKEYKEKPYVLFVNGDSKFNIKNGDAMLNDKAKQIAQAVFGSKEKINKDILGKAVIRQIGVGINGFNVSSCQFAVHYFFENNMTFHNFMRNITECTKLDGYFIGTTYDGKTLFNKLKKFNYDQGLEIYNESNIKLCEIKKKYNQMVFEDDESSIGYKISVYQESINNVIDEYLVNFDYLLRVAEDYGFIIISTEEARSMELPNGSGMFSELYTLMVEESQKKPKSFILKLGDALKMSPQEKKISFLNRYFVFKKIREVDSQKIFTNFINKTFSEVMEEEQFIKKITKPKIRKINKKIIIIPATEEINEKEMKPEEEGEGEEEIIIKPKQNKTKKLKQNK
jgi:hypothetical protein